MQWTIYNADFSGENIGTVNRQITWYKYEIASFTEAWELAENSPASSNDYTPPTSTTSLRFETTLGLGTIFGTQFKFDDSGYHITGMGGNLQSVLYPNISVEDLNTQLQSKYFWVKEDTTQLLFYVCKVEDFYYKTVNSLRISINGDLVGVANFAPTWTLSHFISTVEAPSNNYPIEGEQIYIPKEFEECICYNNEKYYYYTINQIPMEEAPSVYWKKYNYSFDEYYEEIDENIGSSGSQLSDCNLGQSVYQVWRDFVFLPDSGYEGRMGNDFTLSSNKDEALSQIREQFLGTSSYFITGHRVYLTTDADILWRDDVSGFLKLSGTCIGSCVKRSTGIPGSYIGIVQSTLGSLPEEGEVITSSENHYILLIDGSYYEYIKAEASSIAYWKKYAFDWNEDYGLWYETTNNNHVGDIHDDEVTWSFGTSPRAEYTSYEVTPEDGFIGNSPIRFGQLTDDTTAEEIENFFLGTYFIDGLFTGTYGIIKTTEVDVEIEAEGPGRRAFITRKGPVLSAVLREGDIGDRKTYLGLILAPAASQPELGTVLYQESNNRYIIRNADGNVYEYVLTNEDDLVIWEQYEYSITESGWHVTNTYNGDMVTMEYRAYNQDEFGYFHISPGIYSKWEREPAGPISLTGVLKFHNGYIDNLDFADITSSFAPGYFLTTLSYSHGLYNCEAVASVRSVSTSIQTDSQGKPYVYVQIAGEIEKTAIYTVGGEDQGPYIQDVAAPAGEVPNPNYNLYRGDPATDDEIIMQDNYSGEYYQFLRKGSNYNPELGSDNCFYHSEEIDLFYADGDIIVRDNIYASSGNPIISSYEGNVTWIDENDTGITQSATSEIFYDENSDTWSSSHTLFSGIYPALDTSVDVELTYTVMDGGAGGTNTIYASFMNSYQ